MINNNIINEISKLLNNKKIIKYKLISNSFDINCVKIFIKEEIYIAKYYAKKKYAFNAILSEANNLKYFYKKKIKHFPRIIFNNNKYLITEYILNNNKIPNKTNKDFIEAIINIHSILNNFYGFPFNTQIGGVEHKNNKNDNWASFYAETRLYYFLNILNKKNLIDLKSSKKIEKIILKINDFIPQKPQSRLMHGDLWEGNILFNNYVFNGFIDPGSFYGHNEMELAYLRWFNPQFVDKNFLNIYNDYISIDKNYKNYEPIYQLYYALCNLALWDKSYIKEVNRLLKKIGI